MDKMKKLSTIRNQKMPKNRVIHEVMNIIHIIWDKLFVDDRDKKQTIVLLTTHKKYVFE